MPTVAEVVKEYLEKQKNEYESIVIVIGGDKHCFKNVTNLVQVETGEYEFDFVHVPFYLWRILTETTVIEENGQVFEI